MSRRIVAIISAVVIIFIGGYYMGIWQKIFSKKAAQAPITHTAPTQTQGNQSPGLAATIEDISVIWVTIKVEGKNTLFLMLASEGLVNRLGTGAVNNTENDMFIGKTNEPLFVQLRSRFDPRWLPQMGGGYTLPERKGKECELTVGLKFRDGKETGVKFNYGSESQGPPGDIVQFVKDAVGLTTPWYEREKSRVAQTR